MSFETPGSFALGIALLGAIGFVGLPACTQEMASQGRGGLAHLRHAPEGTVPTTETEVAPPVRVTRALLERGQTRFEIHCAPCHGLAGYGDGPVVKRGFLPPPSYHGPRLRAASDARLFEAITRGSGAMASYAARLDAGDRWAVVAYIRALQLSQRATKWTQ